MDNACPFCELLQRPQQNSTFIYEFDYSVAFLNFDQERYLGASILILKQHHEHLHLIPVDLQQAVVPEMACLTSSLLKTFGGFRANHQSLGNQVDHMHWHVIPRYPNDCNAGGPPQHSTSHKKLADDEYKEMATRIRSALEQTT